MANELAGPFGVNVTIQFSKADPAANTTTVVPLSGGQGGSTFVVPVGHVFRPLYLFVASNAALSAGTLTAKVTDNGTAITGGPEPVLSNAAQTASAVNSLTAAGIAAGRTVGVSVVTNAAYAPTTADIDAVLVGVFIPV